MAAQGSHGNISHGPDQRTLLERLRDEGSLTEGSGHVRRPRGRHEGKGYMPLQKSLGDPEALAADNIDIQQSAVEAIVQMRIGFQEGADDTYDFVPLILEDRLQIKCNRRIIF